MSLKPTFRFCLILVLAGLLFSCKKEAIPDRVAAKEHALAESLWTDVFYLVEQASTFYKDSLGKSDYEPIDCATLSFEGSASAFPRTVWIDFGIGCTDYFGMHRKGALKVTYLNPFWADAASAEITLITYSSLGHTMQGSAQLLAKNGSQGRTYTLATAPTLFQNIHKASITWQGTIEIEAAPVPDNYCDNSRSYKLSVLAQGLASSGRNFKVKNISPVFRKSCCRWAFEGVQEIEAEGHSLSTLQYETDNCSNEAGLTSRDSNFSILLY